jgi:hemin uptake protein HemP
MSESPRQLVEPLVNEPQTPGTSAPLPLPLYESAALFQGARVVNITHAGETYRLLITRNNRLILQK